MLDTIYAMSTASGRAGIAVIRISGMGASNVLRVLSRGDLPPPRHAVLTTLWSVGSEEALDRGLVLWFPGRGSFTGEDVVELHIHGGMAVVEAVLEAISAIPGTRMAEPGEFTRRAFLNEKMDLTGAEGKGHWRRLLAFVGARDLAASLETSLVRLGNATARRFANEEVVVEALRGAGC